jgi:uncharacterized membrane protein YphA (DoxX/SURF4 family)
MSYHILSRGATLFRLAVGGLFIWTGLAKLQQPYDFLGAVYNYELVGPQTGFWIAVFLPWLEVGVGVSLVLGFWQQGGAFLAVVLLAVFTLAEASAVGQGLKIPCGCAIGNAPEYTSYWKVAESGLMLMAASLVFVSSLTVSTRCDARAREPNA